MSAPADLWPAVLIGFGLLLALVRLGLWRRAANSQDAGPPWRFPAVLGLNLLVAGLFYLTLDPPDVGIRSGRLLVRTAGAPVAVSTSPGDRVVALPEATPGAGERAPDLATALRRHPEVRSIEVLGGGLTARDRPVVDRPVRFEVPAAPPGLTRLDLPEPVAPGQPFSVSGMVGSLATGTVELLDPSGAVVDRAAVTSGAAFVVDGRARAAGLALFELRIKDAQGRLVERMDVPLEARGAPVPRVIVMAGAPGPEPRFLRRWAEDAGVDLSVQLALGAGVDLTARPAPLTAVGLAEVDLLVIDERRWETLSGAEKGTIRASVAGGMGLLLRPTGPLSETTRRDWAALGVALTGGENLRPLVMDDPSGSPRERAPGADAAAPAPELTRRDFAQSGSDAATLLSAADGTALATWRPYGSGRVGVWVVADSYALVLTGQADRYGAFWSRMFSVLARAEGPPPPRLDGIGRAGHRVSLCGVSNGQVLLGPDGSRRRLIVDPRSGPTACAAIWPRRSGWHAVVDAEGERGVVYVHPADATPSLIAADLREGTRALVLAGRTREAAMHARTADGSPWPWFVALLAALTALWWLERRRPVVSS